MTERNRSALQRTAQSLTIGPSSLTWDGTHLAIAVAERGAPVPRRVRGHIRVTATAHTPWQFTLDEAGRHRWWPIAPTARIAVAMTDPQLTWQGQAYLDTNAGDEPLERGFRCWNWSRATLPDGKAAIFYDVIRRDGKEYGLSLGIGTDGTVQSLEAPPQAALPATGVWRMSRATRSDAGSSARVLETLEDTPFYARSVLSTQIDGAAATSVHESLSLDRFRHPVVRLMLPFRMPRVWWW